MDLLLDLVAVGALPGVGKDYADNVTLLMLDIQRFLEQFHLTVPSRRQFVLQTEWLKSICFLKSAVELQDHIVAFQAVPVVPIDRVKEHL